MRRFAVLTALLALTVAPLGAQARTFTLGVSGGLSVPMGDLSDGASSGYNLGGHVYLRPARFANLGFRGDVTFDRFGLKEREGNIRSLGFAANAVYNVPTSGSTVRPYVLAGLGFFDVKSTVTVGSAEVSGGESNLGLQAGAGMSFQLSGFATFVEARFVNVMSDPNATNFLPIVFGFRF